MHSMILGVGYYVPETILDNSYFERLNPLNVHDKDGNVVEQVHTSHEKIMEVMGIRERRKIADGEEVYHLATRAAQRALDHAHLTALDLEGIVVATVSNRQRFPSTAVRVQEYLNARNVHYCIDLAAACAGFPFAVDAANKRAIQTGKPCLAIGAEALTRITDYTNINCALFGDGAGAVIVGPPFDTSYGVRGFLSESDPFEDKSGLIFQNPDSCIWMPKGRPVLKAAVRTMTDLTLALKRELGWAEADLYIPHQANVRVVEGYLKQLRVDRERVFNNIEYYGNMSTATCAVGFAQAVEQQKVGKGSKVVVVSVGSGLQTSSVGLLL